MIILLHEKFLQFDWLRAVIFQLNFPSGLNTLDNARENEIRLHHLLKKLAVVESFKQESMYGLSAGTKKKTGRCGEVAVSGDSTVPY